MENEKAHRGEWHRRFEAVGRAQARYLYLLLVSGAFCWALHVQVVSVMASGPSSQELPVVGVTVNRTVDWATAPILLGFVLLAAPGTFDALLHASDMDMLRIRAKGDERFERLDVSPTAIDFIVYGKSRFLRRVGLFSYPFFLPVIYSEAWWI